MSQPDSESLRPWVRPTPTQSGPNRHIGGFYRTAESKGTALGGIPLQTAEDAVVAAVRMAYKVAEAQVDRSARLARRLRKAGNQAVGPGSDRQALDATERLVFRAMMGGLGWLEGVAAERDSPLMRILTAQYRMLGSMLGLVPTTTSATATASTHEGQSTRAGPPKKRSENLRRTKPSSHFLKVQHTGNDRRMVQVAAADIGDVASASRTTLTFYNTIQAGTVARHRNKTLAAELVVRGKGDATIQIDTPLSAPSGVWRAAVCDDDGLQLGFVEVIL
jgi:hypothetical protein